MPRGAANFATTNRFAALLPPGLHIAVMTEPSEPGHIAILRAYVTRSELQDKPLFVSGETGTGKRYWIDKILGEAGYKPVWLTEPHSIPESNLDGERCFPCLRLDSVKELPGQLPTIIVIPSQKAVPYDILKNCRSVIFPLPDLGDRREFLRAIDAPETLAEGNPNYPSLLTAASIWRQTGALIAADVNLEEGWAGWMARGEEPPGDGPFLAYYAAYNSARGYGEAGNHLAWLQRKLPARLKPTLLRGIRATWGNTVEFPQVLRGKAYKGRAVIDGAAECGGNEDEGFNQRGESEGGNGRDAERRKGARTYQYSMSW